MPGVLYIVGTPIGNLEDITLRAIRTLKEANLIAAEDTRHTQILLKRFEIHTPLTSYHEHNERSKAPELVARLGRGENIALVSDAGTPAISDPGYRLVFAALQGGIRVVPIPGPSAVISALSASGLPSDGFLFAGFLPAKKQERRTKLQSLRNERHSIVFYEAPHRLREALDDMHLVFGDRRVVVARELTKVHEQFLRGRLSEVIGQVAAAEIRGEITVIIEGSSATQAVSTEELRKEIEQLQNNGMRLKEIAEVLGERYGYSKRDIYQLALNQADKTKP
jgi:16S rRNA (cytidine1402-2'-O)-methyltransferase